MQIFFVFSNDNEGLKCLCVLAARVQTATTVQVDKNVSLRAV